MDAEEQIIEMMNGCICCTVRQDLVVVLAKLAERVASGDIELDGIIIETTGMADPAPVAQTFFVDEQVKRFARLDGIITLVDAKHIEQHLDEIKPEGAENEAIEQLAFADRIILNKTDLVTLADLTRVEARIKSINAFAPIVRSEQSQVTVESVLNIKGFDLTRTLEMDPEFLDIEAEHEHDASIGSLSICADGDVHMLLVNDFISEVLKTKGNDVYRMKGVLSMAGEAQKFVYQGVHMIFDGKFEGSWAPEETRCNKLVFIGKNLDKTELEESFRACLDTPENAARIAAVEEVASMERHQKFLLSAAARDDIRAIMLILATTDADVNWGNVIGQTALHVACIWANASAVAALVKAGANVDKKNQMGENTPAHMLASRVTHPEKRVLCAQILLEAGVNLKATNVSGELAWQIVGGGEDDFPELRALLTPTET